MLTLQQMDFKASYGSDESFFVSLSSDLCTMSWFNDVGYQQYGIGSYLYTLLLKDKIQALAAGDIVAWEVAIIKAAISNLIKF